jgi:hypothetical protein
MKQLFTVAAAILLLTTITNPITNCYAQGTAFTYQGRLSNGTNAATGSYDLRFALFDAVTAGGQQANLLTNSATPITNGLFTVTLDFGNQFPGAPRWLEIAVRTNGAATFTNLAPRQQLTPVPYAVFASGISGVSVQQNSSGAPNVILGSTANNISGNIVGATIGGGGATNYAGGGPVPNSVTASFATVSGGAQNTASFVEATVGGGYGNTASAQAATVSGGINNTASGLFATVPGGNGNTASGNFSFAAGHLAQAVNSGSFVWADSQNAFFTSTANDQFLIRAAGGVGIGTATPAKQLDVTGNAIGLAGGASIDPSVFVRVNNSATDGNTSSPDCAGIGFGNNSTRQAIVGGTYGNDYLDFYTGGLLTSPKLRIDFGGNVGIGTGVANPVSKLQVNGTVTATSFVGSGSGLTGLNGANVSGVALLTGGNAFSGQQTVSGNLGIGTTTPTTEKLVVVGGIDLTAPATTAANDGGLGLSFESYGGRIQSFQNRPLVLNPIANSVGVGVTNPATKLHVKSSGDTELSLQSSDNNRRWTLQASGGTDGVGLGGTFQILDRTAVVSRFRIDTNGMVTIPAELTTTAVNITSDRNAKENFAPVNARAVLDKVASLPITEWQYKQNAEGRHIGPMAQDFSSAFALGHDDKHISIVDESGVALAAIQGLNEKLAEKDAELQRLQSQNQSLAARLEAIERVVGLTHGSAASAK